MYCDTQLLVFRFSFSLHHLGRITKGCSNNYNSESLLYIYIYYTTQLYSNLVMKYYLSVPCVGCPCVSKISRVRLASLCTLLLSTHHTHHVISIKHSPANVSLILISENKGGPTPGH